MDLREPLASVTVKAAGIRPPVTVAPGAPVREAIATMREHEVGCVVVTEGGKPAGIFTERDLLKRVFAAGAGLDGPVREHMSAPVVTRAESPLNEALARMLRGGFRHLPVVDAGGALVGTTSIKRAVHFLAEHLPEAVLNLPPRPDDFPASEEGG